MNSPLCHHFWLWSRHLWLFGRVKSGERTKLLWVLGRDKASKNSFVLSSDFACQKVQDCSWPAPRSNVTAQQFQRQKNRGTVHSLILTIKYKVCTIDCSQVLWRKPSCTMVLGYYQRKVKINLVENFQTNKKLTITLLLPLYGMIVHCRLLPSILSGCPNNLHTYLGLFVPRGA